MHNDTFKEILEKLNGLEYFFISGLSVAVYTKGKRISGDIDIAIKGNDIDVFAARLGVVAKNRKIDKGTFIVEDYGFEVNYKGQIVECTSGYPVRRVKEGTFGKLFSKRLKKEYLGNEVYIEPIEELVNQKIFMNRDKDKRDIELLKDFVLNKSFFKEICEDKLNTEQVLSVADKIFEWND